MKEFFIELFEYSLKYNIVIAQALKNSQLDSNEIIMRLYCHIINAHHIWNSRILSDIPKFGVWEIHKIEFAIELANKNHNNTLLILDKNILSDEIIYRNTKNIEFKNSVQDILFHIINHSTHHRAQIVSEIRKSGAEPPVTDYIFFKRKN